jgi:predicted lysophospholipase L1 biosynthesis ABC-type transport system permease subunit
MSANSLDPTRSFTSRWMQLVAALSGAFSGGTAAWIVVALLTPGDFFGQGSVWILPSLAAATLAGAFVGYRLRSRRGFLVLACFTLLCSAFWAAAPRGFWVTPPPRPEAR